MKIQNAKRRGTRALTLIELLVIIVIVAMMAGMILPAGRAPGKGRRIRCASNLRQLGLASIIWAEDNGKQTPRRSDGNPATPRLANVSWPSTGTPAAPATSPYTYLVFAAMSNELNDPKILVCPTDDRPARTNFGNDLIGPTGAHNLGVSYFVGRDASASNPNAFLDGDRNICADTTATPIPNHGYGISPDGTAQGAACEFPRNYKSIQNLGFGPKMHHSTGNVGLADGSVQQFSQSGFVAGLRTSAAATTNIAAQNYLLFP